MSESPSHNLPIVPDEPDEEAEPSVYTIGMRVRRAGKWREGRKREAKEERDVDRNGEGEGGGGRGGEGRIVSYIYFFSQTTL